MKVMKKILKSVFVLILLSAFVSCGNFFSEKNSVKNAEEAKTILKISVENNLSARTITPDNSEGILSDFVLKGKKANTTKEPEEIARAENISELNALTIVFDNKDTGEWEFILTGQYTIGTDENQQTIRFTSEQTVEIKKNQMNSVSFKLRNEDLPYGGLNLTVQFADETNTVSSVMANLYNDDFSVDETIEFTTRDFEQTAQQGVKKISIIKNLTDLSRLPADCYQLELYFYTSEKEELNSILNVVQIVNGLTTTATLNIAVNQMYALNYEFYLNGTKLSVKDGQLLPDNVQIKNGGVLPGKYITRVSTPLPDLAMEGYGFSGWYDSARGGHVVTDASATGSYAPRTLYARFFTAEYTVGSGGDYDSIAAAFEQIRNFATNTNRTNIDWTIKVIGTLTGCQQIDDQAIDGFAGSIFVTGNTIPELGEDPTDIIDANLSNPTYYGAALIITASTPVTIKNIKITGGNNDNSDSYVKGGGLYIGPGTDVTLGDGVLITENRASQGSGIYTVDDFNMQGSACVSSDNEIYLGSDSSKITVTGQLTASKSATITPYSYEVDFRVLYSGQGINLKDEYEQFDITQQQGSTNVWRLRPNGLITKHDYTHNIINNGYGDIDYYYDYVDLGLTSGTLWSTVNYGHYNGYQAGVNVYWTGSDYGDQAYHGSYSAWGEEWSIASTEEWEELVNECYWVKALVAVPFSGNGSSYKVYYVYKAKDPADKGNLVNPLFSSPTAEYNSNEDIYILIAYSDDNKTCYYWPQVFVNASTSTSATNNVTQIIDISGTQPNVNALYNSSLMACSQNNSPAKNYIRLVISKKRNLVVTPNGSDTNTGLNARNNNALQTIQGAINKIQNTDGSDEIDWTIIYFGELTPGLKITGYDSSNMKSLTIYSETGSGANSTKIYWDIDASGTLVYHNSIGDLLLNDGSFVYYDETRTNFTTEQIQNAVGVVCALGEYNKANSILGLKNSQTTTYKWAESSAAGATTLFTEISCSDNGNNIFSGDTDGSDNWAYICSLDPTGTADASTNYPAFNYANTYASSVAGFTGDYADGWYLPSIVELSTIYSNIEKLNSILSKVNGNTLSTGSSEMYMSSSQHSSTDSGALAIKMADGSIQNIYKTMAEKVCVIRTANLLPEYAVIFNTDGGSTVAAQKVISGQNATIPVENPSKDDYIFAGWYSDSAFTTKFNFDTEITGHTILYAKWTEPLSVGDLLLSDGTFVAYNASRENFESELTGGKIPVGIIYDLDEYGLARGILGIMDYSDDTSYRWAKNNTDGYTTKIENIICTPSESGTGTAQTAIFTGDLDGSDNWDELSIIDNVLTNYSAFDTVNGYVSSKYTELSGTAYNSGWYMPSLAELCYIYRNKTKLDKVLTAIKNTTGFDTKADSFGDYGFWSSSQDADNAKNAWSVTFNTASIMSVDKTSPSKHVCVIRKLN